MSNGEHDYGHDDSEAQAERRSSTYNRHWLAIRFGMPPLSEKSPAFVAMQRNIKVNGRMEHPVLLYEGESGALEVLEGWNRYNAALAADVEPKFEVVEGPPYEALKRLITGNMRPHPNYNQRLHAAVRAAAEIAMTHGGDRRSAEFVSNASDQDLRAQLGASDEMYEAMRVLGILAELSLPKITNAMLAAWFDVSETAIEHALPVFKKPRPARYGK
jgi:hypothetical protein